MSRIAFWLLDCPVPDPELKLELMGWAMALLWLGQVWTRVRS